MGTPNICFDSSYMGISVLFLKGVFMDNGKRDLLDAWLAAATYTN